MSQSCRQVFIANHVSHPKYLAAIAPLLNQSLAEQAYPGAVILASYQDRIVYRGVFGYSRIMPDCAPMQFTTLFDLASLTKVMVTTTAIMQLIEQNKLALDMPLAHYWPAFGSHGKTKITLRHLLTHTSGLPPLLFSSDLLAVFSAAGKPMPVAQIAPWQGYDEAIALIEQCKLEQEPGSTLLYGDLNFIALGHVLQLVSGLRLDQYARQNIFLPLGMKQSQYLPLAAGIDPQTIAPTQLLGDKLRWGQVHDPTTWLMGGISGAAGLFSTASDIALFANCLVNQGLGATRILKASSVKLMTSRQTPAGMAARGLGWDINSPFSCRGELWPESSFDHTGWTGTSLLFEPEHKLWLLVLTSRSHPHINPSNNLLQDRRKIADFVWKSLF